MTAYEVLLTVSARLAALQLCLCFGNITPLDWRNIQLNGLASTGPAGEYLNFLQEIRKKLRKLFPNNNDLTQFTSDLLSLHSKKQYRRIICALDEANVLVDKYPNTFLSSTNTLDRPLWRVVGSTLANFYSLDLIIAGTAISLKSKEIIFSATAKLGHDAGRKLIIHTSFRFSVLFDERLIMLFQGG